MNNIERLVEELQADRSKAYADAELLREWKLSDSVSLGKMIAFDQCIQKLQLLLKEETAKDLHLPDNILRNDHPYSLSEVLKALIEATDILLHKKDYDGHGWERYEYCYRHAKDIVAELDRNGA